MTIQDDIGIPKSRVTLRYRTEINGVPEDVTLPLRILVAGDFSGFGQKPLGHATFGERDPNDPSLRASIEKRQIFNARDIINVVTKKENGNKLKEKEYYNSVFNRLNVAISHKTELTETDYQSAPYSRENVIKKIDDLNPRNFNLGKPKESNADIANLISKLVNNRDFYSEIRALIKWTVTKKKSIESDVDEIIAKYLSGVGLKGGLTKTVFDFYRRAESKEYIVKLRKIVSQASNLPNFDAIKDDSQAEERFYDIFLQLQDLKGSIDELGDSTYSQNAEIKAYTGCDAFAEILTEIDDLAASSMSIGELSDFAANLKDVSKNQDFAKGLEILTNSELLAFLNLERLHPFHPVEVVDFNQLVSFGAFELEYSDPDSGSKIIGEFKTHLAEMKRANDEEMSRTIDDILHDPHFKYLESNWRALEYLVKNTDFSKDIRIDFIDVAKSELEEDFAANQMDIPNSFFFKRVYTDEYDQYGGQPYGAIIGLYEFENSEKDRNWLEVMGKISNLAHCPFISSVGPKFFVDEDNIYKLAEIRDLAGHMMQPKFDSWNALRDTEEAAYLGFTVSRFMIRPPYDVKSHRAGGLNYTETITGSNKLETHQNYCWANSAILFAQNLIKSYEETSWCQTIRGPKNGGYIQNLARHQFEKDGLILEKAPVEIVLPDYRELSFAKCGFMALISKKETSSACFFSCQSIKKDKKFKDDDDTKNSQLVTNLSYTFSITKIAHYIKCIMRDNIGGTADSGFITNTINTWLNDYVTTVVNPDDLTLRRYPFKAISVETKEREAAIGWYDCTVSVLPHLQFEGLDTELRLETRLGSK